MMEQPSAEWTSCISKSTRNQNHLFSICASGFVFSVVAEQYLIYLLETGNSRQLEQSRDEMKQRESLINARNEEITQLTSELNQARAKSVPILFTDKSIN
jgi:hypothetical protein